MDNNLDLEPLKHNEFDGHKLIAFNFDKVSGLRGYIAIHRLRGEHPSFGATRYWRYKSDREALKDALRLSRTMSYKAALSGLPGGGAKAVIVGDGYTDKRKDAILSEYARRVNYLSGKFVTGSDVGLTRDDVKKMRRISPYFVGTKVSPERFTALGLYYCIRESLKHVYGNSHLNDKSFAIQGIGKVGQELLSLLYKEGATIFVADIDQKKIRSMKKKFPKIKVAAVGSLHRRQVNVYSPCALSDCINTKSIKELNCDIILGGANNQLENNKLSYKLHKKGILYAPDYVVNAGGLISVYDEYENHGVKVMRIKHKVEKISDTLGKIFRDSKKMNKPPLEIANKMAENIFNGR
jgi:leucine dehydrogenase